jgi:alkyl hydroperoxide reductase subunit AhpC
MSLRIGDEVPDFTAQTTEGDIAQTQGTPLNYPLIGDTDLKVAKLYDMIHPNASGSAASRTAADNATIRSVFVAQPK